MNSERRWNKAVRALALAAALLLAGCGADDGKGSGKGQSAMTPEGSGETQQTSEQQETAAVKEYSKKEIWVQSGEHRIYGVAYVPGTGGRAPLVIFSHELGNDHTSGERYAERLAAAGYAAYVFDFCGGTVGGNRSDGSNKQMSVLTEASDLEAVL